MKQQENISRRDALKRMAKTAMAVAVASMFPSEDTLANNADLNIQYHCCPLKKRYSSLK